MTEPLQKPRGTSKQNYRTPPAFLHAVQAQFGEIIIDLAADGPNVCERWFGPGSPLGEDAFAEDWFVQVPLGGRHIAYLNPPFGHIKPWAQKCIAEAANGCRIVMLTPYSCGERQQLVAPHSMTLGIRPRLQFVGTDHLYPKDLCVTLFGFGMMGMGAWRWRR